MCESYSLTITQLLEFEWSSVIQHHSRFNTLNYRQSTGAYLKVFRVAYVISPYQKEKPQNRHKRNQPPFVRVSYHLPFPGKT